MCPLLQPCPVISLLLPVLTVRHTVTVVNMNDGFNYHFADGASLGGSTQQSRHGSSYCP